MNAPEFDPALPILESRAPARLDVMGGVSDYAGGTFLQWPLECGTSARAQVLGDSRIIVHSAQNQVEVDSTWLQLDAQEALKYLEHNRAWSTRVLGALLILRDENLLPDKPSSTWGLRLELESDAPPNAGVASSAAITVATLQVLALAFELDLDGEKIAHLAHRVQSQIVGDSRSLVDFLAVAVGKPNHLLRVKCQPAIVEGFEALPQGVQVLGVDSGARNPAPDEHRRARIGAMMGRRILGELVPHVMRGPDGNLYLANIGSDIWRALRDRIPPTMRGVEFHRRYGSHEDSASAIHAEEEYAVRLPTEHPIYEADRAARFCDLLRAVDASPSARREILQAAGELMVQSHFSYSHRCNLSSPNADLLVSLAREAGAKSGIYGAKVTGGGAGGTVAFLLDNLANADLSQVLAGICEEYEKQSGNRPRVLKSLKPNVSST